MADRATKPKADILNEPVDVNIISGSSGGTEYTEGDTDTSITGTAVMMETDGNLLKPIQGTVANGSYGVITITPGHVSTDNSTTTPLGSGGVFTGVWESVINHGIIIVTTKASHASATDGLSIQFSTDGTNIDNTDEFTMSADVGKTFSFQTAAKYFRVVYTNGATPQTYFRLQSILKPNYAKPSSHRISDSLSLQDDAELVKAVIAGETTAGGGSFVNVKVNPSGTLETNATISELPNEGQQTMANSISVAIASNQTAVPVSGTFYQATQPVSATDLDIRNLSKTQDEVYSVLKTDAGVAYDARLVTVQNSSIPVTDNAGSLTVDAPVATPVFVRLSDGAAAISTLPVSLASVPSHAVTNAGTFAVQSTNQANSGVDIGDVTINNASGAAAVNIQDGGNSITVDGSVTATLSAETTKVIGTVNVSTGQTITDVPATSGGLSKFHLVGAATSNATNVKASAGQVYAITAFNIASTPAYLKFHNTAGTPTAGSGVTDTFLIPGNTSGAGIVINIDKGIAFSTGIGISIVTGIADANTTAIAADNVVVNIYYK